jgi:CubicO group peptidase (beta-lactamase class C family)/inosine-uridine nucleoside N-ribohydrolase
MKILQNLIPGSAFLFLAFMVAAATARTPVILDTDIGDDIDDTWALVMLLKSPELDLKLVTTTCGKAEYRARLIAKLLTVAGRTDVAVGLGEGGRDGSGGQEAWIADFKLKDYPGVVHQDGAGAIIELIDRSPQPVTIISIGPSHTLAAVLKRRPDVAGKASYVGMQGSVFKGYDGGAVDAEYNVKANAAAARAVLSAPWKQITITPLDTCGTVTLTGARFKKLLDSDDRMVKTLLENYRVWAKKKQVGELNSSSVLFDTVAVYLAYHDRPLVKFQTLPITVTVDGFTKVDPRGTKMQVAASWVDRDAYDDLLVKILTRPEGLGRTSTGLPAALAYRQGGLKGSDSAATKADAIFSPLADANSPGLAVLVRKDGRVVFQRGYGVRDLVSMAKIDAQTNFRLASCSKQFTAMSIMLLVHDGKLGYNDRLTDIIPEFPAYGRTITIRNLLNHTSGLPDYEDLMDRLYPHRWSAEHQIQDREVLALLEEQKETKFPPGTKWSYSNSGYVVLGCIAAKLSGKSFPDFLRERVFVPLRMDHTLAFEKGKQEIFHRAFGHTKDGSGWTQTDQSSTSATLGDGGVYSSLIDLEKWDEALARHTLLSEHEMRAALTPVKLAGGLQPAWPPDSDRPAGTPVAYGFGFFLDPHRGRDRMWHYGDTMGFHTYVERFVADRLSIIVLCNRTDLDPEKLAAEVADLDWTTSK